MDGPRERILWWAALRLVKRSDPIVIGVGGAIAKTSTKEAIKAVLDDAFPGQVQTAYGNLNTYLGVPLAILGFKIDFYENSIKWQWPIILIKAVVRAFYRKIPRYLVLEYGTDRTGDIPALVAKIRPKIALLTIVGPAHLANYSSERAIAEEEGALVEAVPSDGLVVLNRQDPYLLEHKERVVAAVMTVDCSLENIAESYAREVGRYFKIDENQIAASLSNRQLPKRRFNRYQTKSWLILDDSYNANPLSMKAALNILKNTKSRRRVAILGDMLELGPDAIKMHQEVGRIARDSSDQIIGVGQLSKEYQPDYWYENSDLAAKQLLAHLKEDDTILVKGSRGIKMEKIVKRLNGDI